ncbi:MAG TPA: heme o synthase [Pyrinomonadaceae bacterium]|jgi:protoheme IX farnesyltransferase|nr:heme o synthase [Pyrinomonadaceae bacterium]
MTNSVAVKLEPTETPEAPLVPLVMREKLTAYVQLTKPRITLFIVLTAAAGFCLGTKGALDYALLAHTLFGVALLSSGIATLNQYMERDLDGRMRRTAARPLPAGKLRPFDAFVFGVALTATAEAYLALVVNPLTALLGLSVIVGYLFCYTPLKTRTSLSTVVGAFPGAMPPLVGWAAANNAIGVEAWTLFAILFLWQFPHFLAIAWMYREDYARAGIVMLPVVEPEGLRTGQQIVIWALLLLPVSLMPTALGTSGAIYFFGAIVLGLLYIASSVAAAVSLSRRNARRVLLASVLYLPVLFGLMVFNM